MHTMATKKRSMVCRGLELLEADTSLARKAFSLCRPTRGCFSCCPSRLRYCSTVVSFVLSFLPMLAKTPLLRLRTYSPAFSWVCARRSASVFSWRGFKSCTKRSTAGGGMDIMIGELAASTHSAMTQSLTSAQIGAFLVSQDSDQDLLGGAAAKKEREIIQSNRVKLADYIHDVTTLFPLLRQEGIFSRDDVEIIEAPVTTTAKVDKFLDVLLRKGWLPRLCLCGLGVPVDLLN